VSAETTSHALYHQDISSRADRRLLSLAGVFIFINFHSLTLSRQSGQITDWVPFILWVACAISGSYLLDRYLPQHDPLLFSLAMFLTGWGLVIIDRLAPAFADRQTAWLVIALAALLAVAILPQPLRWLRRYRYTLLILGLALLISTIILGTNPSGQATAPRLWLGVGNIFFQPSEVLKIILVAFLASYLGEQYPGLRTVELGMERRWLSLSPRIFGPILLMWGLSVIILIWQRDLGTAVLFFIVFLVLLYMASGNGLILVSGALLIVVAGFVAYYLFDVVQLRVDIWLNPWPEADGRSYQIVQSLLAFSAGGVFGQGIGQGLPTFIPVVHSDFVFAAVAEEWGLLGVIVVVIAIASLVMRGLRTAVKQQSRPFHVLLSVGLSMLIATQSLLIMGGTLKLVPLTGVTLPFLSYGGSSLLMSFVMIGLLLRLSAEAGIDAVHPAD
jgi:cell division protein FtsW (lipid II flippase)